MVPPRRKENLVGLGSFLDRKETPNSPFKLGLSASGAFWKSHSFLHHILKPIGEGDSENFSHMDKF